MRWAFSSLLIICSLSLFSQEKWSLQRCIDYAFENNLQIKEQGLLINREENALLQSKLSLLPSLSFDSNYIFSKGNSSLDGSIKSTITIFDGLVNVNSIKYSQLSLEHQLLEATKRKLELCISITQRYLEYLLERKYLEIAQTNLNNTFQEQNIIEKKINAGEEAHSALFEINAQVANDSAQITKHFGDIELAKIELMQLLNIDLQTPFDVEDSEIHLVEEPFRREFYLSLCNKDENIPAIKSAEKVVEMSQLELKIAKGLASPVVSGSFGINSLFDKSIPLSFSDQINNNHLVSSAITLSIPLFNKYSVATKIKDAKVEIAQSELLLEQTRLDFRKEIISAITQTENDYHNYLASSKKVEANSHAFEICKKKLRAGVATVNDYILAQNRLSEAQIEQTQYLFQYLFHLKIINLYLNPQDYD